MFTHPLATQSLTPLGFTSPISLQRLSSRPICGGANYENLIARLWERVHLRDAQRPLPAKTIVHDILPTLSSEHRVSVGEFSFDGRPYLSRDIALLSTVVQWLGTNSGRCFLYDTPIGFVCTEPELEFIAKFKRDYEDRTSLVAQFTHECSELCGVRPSYIGSSCHFDQQTISERDNALIRSVMLWLGTRAGRSFIVTYTRRRNRVAAVVERRRLLRFARQRTAA